MDIIRCDNCGHYQKNNGDLCHGCNLDFSEVASYTIIDNQDVALERWEQLQEKGFNDYMESIDSFVPPPTYMICPICKFKMLSTEKLCPKCETPVMYVKPTSKKWKPTNNMTFIEKFFYYFFGAYIKVVVIGVIVLFMLAFIYCLFS